MDGGAMPVHTQHCMASKRSHRAVLDRLTEDVLLGRLVAPRLGRCTDAHTSTVKSVDR